MLFICFELEQLLGYIMFLSPSHLLNSNLSNIILNKWLFYLGQERGVLTRAVIVLCLVQLFFFSMQFSIQCGFACFSFIFIISFSSLKCSSYLIQGYLSRARFNTLRIGITNTILCESN